LKKKSHDLKIYGISQNPNTKDYILVQNNLKEYCVKCGKVYAMIKYKWCQPICRLKENLYYTSENEKIDKFIQKKQLEINYPWDFVFEWIPYNQLDEIIEIDESKLFALYSATWKNGPLYWDVGNEGFKRSLNKKVVLKCIYNYQNITDFLNEV
jgi:hypothetical protein